MNSPPLVKITDEVINTLKRELPEDSVYVLLVFPHAGLGTDSDTEPTLHEYLLSEYQ